MDLTKAMTISARGMDAQTTRLRVIAENLANQDTTGDTPGATPYRRKTITFEQKMDRFAGSGDRQGQEYRHRQSQLSQAL